MCDKRNRREHLAERTIDGEAGIDIGFQVTIAGLQTASSRLKTEYGRLQMAEGGKRNTGCVLCCVECVECNCRQN